MTDIDQTIKIYVFFQVVSIVDKRLFETWLIFRVLSKINIVVDHPSLTLRSMLELRASQ